MDSNVKLSPSSSNNHPSASRAKSPTSGACSSTGMTWSGSETPIMSAMVQQAHDQQVADGNTVHPRPSPTQPFGEYVATSMFLGDRSPIGLVAACAATLYLTRENPKLLEMLVDVFATEFPVHKRDIITRFQGIAERKRIRLESTKARTYVAAAAQLSPSGSSSALDEGESRGFHNRENPVVSSTVPPPVTLTTAPSSPAVVLVGRVHQQHYHHNHANDEEAHNGSLEEDERASTKSPDGDDGHVSMGPKKRTLLPRDPSVATSGTPSTITGSSNDPPSVNRTTSYQLVDEGGVNRTTSYQLTEESPSHHFDPHHQPPPPPALTLMADDAGPSSQQQATATASSHLPPANEQHPPRPILSVEVGTEVHDKVGLSDDVVTLARCLQHRRETSSPAFSGGDVHSGPSSPTNASSHSTIQPLFRERTSDLLANPEMISNFFFTMVQGLVNLYFSYNWDVVDDVLQINQEYLRYVEEKLIPRVLRWVRTKDPALAARGLEEYENKRASNKKSTSSNAPATANPLKAENSAMIDDHPATAEWLDFHGSTDSLTVGEMDSRATSQLWQQPSTSSSVFFSGKESAQLGDVIPSTESDDQLLSVTPPLREDKTSKDGSTSSGIIGGDASTMPFKFVTSDNVSEFLYLARDSPQRPLVLFFHVPFSQPSCTMWDVLSTVQRRCADSPTAPIIGLVQGVTEVELADTFTVTWYPTVILIPSGSEHYVQVLSLIDRCTAATHRQQLHQAYDDIRMNCLAASSQEFEEDIPASSTSPRGEAAPKHFQGFPCAQQFDSEDEAELEAAHISSDNNNHNGGATTTAPRRSVTPPSVSTSRCCERANEIQQEMSLLESIVGLRGTTPSRSRSPARDISTALTQEHHGEGVIFFRFPEKGIVMTDPVMEWIKGEGKVEAKQRKVKAWITRLVALTAQMKFKPMRQLHSAVVMLRRLQGSGTKESGGNHLIFKDDGQIEFEATTKAHTSAEDPPFFIFLGGGMAAGKTTAATALTRSEWWEAHKDQVVVVDADTFKMADPIRKTKPSDLHEQSTKYAEKLLVTALNQGRSVIFDGTMMWAPFVEQTAAMVREAHTHYFSMGPGFDEKLNIEQYWERGNARSVPLEVPYHILFLAITVEPHEAVPRGILRGVTTGRTVPIRSQLRSFRLFSEGFERYASLCDEVTLYNNNIRVDLEQGQLPPRILHKDSKDQEIVVEDAQAYENFRRHRTINDRATCCDEIYHPAAAATTPTPADGFGRRASFSSSFTTSTPPKASKPFSSSGSYSSVKL